MITDAQLIPAKGLPDAVRAALEGGARWVQYRDKSHDADRRFREARQLCSLCHARGAGFLVNDDLELALACGADGVHLGKEDTPLEQARARLGPRAIIGVSCYNSLERARSAALAGADYLAFGSFFPSPTKPEATPADLALLPAARGLGRPICVIGGINANNATSLLEQGADMIAVISAVFGAQDIQAASRQLAALCEARAEPPRDASHQVNCRPQSPSQEDTK